MLAVTGKEQSNGIRSRTVCITLFNSQTFYLYYYDDFFFFTQGKIFDKNPIMRLISQQLNC